MIKVYAYDKNTKEYTGVEYAQENPKRKGNYIMPANTTSVQVGEYEKGFIPVFDGDGWVLKKDLRGQMQVELSTFQTNQIDYLGGVKEGFQIIDEKTYADFLKNPDGFKVVEGVFTDITDTAEYKNEQRKKEILKELKNIDDEAVRPLRAKLTGKATQEDEDKLLLLEEKADVLRKELKDLGGV